MHVVKGIDALGGIEYEPNIYVIDGEVVVDTGTGKNFAGLKRTMEAKYDIYKIKTIVNTHCHFDHVGGNKKFRDWLKAEVCSHAADKDSIETGRNTMAEMFEEVARTTTVDRVLKEGSKIKTKNFSFSVIHTPGHTPGSICLYDESKKILISGDTVFGDNIGRTDLPGGDMNKMIVSLNKLLDYHIEYVLPGHGAPKVGGVSFLLKQLIAHFGKRQFVNYEFY